LYAVSDMSPQKKTIMKPTRVEPSSSSQQKTNIESTRNVYDDTSIIVDKYGDILNWGEVYHMFKKSNFSTEAEDEGELQAFKNIIKS